MIRGRILYKGEFVEAGIEVENGKVKRIAKLVGGKELKGLILPAGIDVHVHLRDFTESEKETIESGTLSALHGGICLVVDQPNTKPPVDNEDVYFKRMEIAERKVYTDYALNLALTNSNCERIEEIMRKVSEKYYVPAIGEVFLQHGDSDMQISYTTLKRAYESFRNFIFTIHAEDPNYVSSGSPNFLFRKREAEIVAVSKVLEMGKFHFCHISTKDAACKILQSNSTFEVSPHHMLLSLEDYRRLGSFVNVNPPLREKNDAEWLLKNFSKIDVLASDHAPHTVDDKYAGLPGFPGVETMYPIFVNLALKGYVSFKDLAEKIAKNPARIFGFHGYGEIEVGNYANFAIFDQHDRRTIKAEHLHSKCGWTPYEGFEAVFPYKVYLRGEEVLESELKAGKILKK